MGDEALEKWPRHYAKEILAEPSLEKRRAMLAEVPERLRPIVESHVRMGWGKK